MMQQCPSWCINLHLYLLGSAPFYLHGHYFLRINALGDDSLSTKDIEILRHKERTVITLPAFLNNTAHRTSLPTGQCHISLLC